MTGPQTEPAPYYPAEHVPHNLMRDLRKTFAAFFSTSRVINRFLTKLARDRAGRISARTDKTSGRYSPSTALALG